MNTPSSSFEPTVTHDTVDSWESVVETDLGERDGWQVIQREGSAHDLHQSDHNPVQPTLILNQVKHPAVVLGSTQRNEVLNADVVQSAGLHVARRRSGGGYVVMIPGESMWVDIYLPRHDDRWHDDVERATWWLGRAWQSWLVELGITGTWSMHERGVSDRKLGRLICFAAAGPGELFLDGQKIVGISQHRNRYRARFQCVIYSHFRADLEVALLAPNLATELDYSHDDLVGQLRSQVREIPDWWGNVENGLWRFIPHLER